MSGGRDHVQTLTGNARQSGIGSRCACGAIYVPILRTIPIGWFRLDCWRTVHDCAFYLIPGLPLIQSLVQAMETTQFSFQVHDRSPDPVPLVCYCHQHRANTAVHRFPFVPAGVHI
jgi:hypothetical protein